MQSKDTPAPSSAPAQRRTLTLKTPEFPQPFFVVWKIGGWRPKKRHRDLDTALVQARRLAELHPGERFNIFQCTFAGSQYVRQGGDVEPKP